MKQKLYYTGVGSRKTPDSVLDLMTKIATKLEELDYTLRSGGASGADGAFADGCKNKDIYLPWTGFNWIDDSKLDQAEDWTYPIAEKLHPAWDRCSRPVRKLHARNVHQVLGNTDNPDHSKFLIAWTPRGRMIGGTATAIKLAKQHDIAVYNLAIEDDVKKLSTNLKLDLT